MESCSVLKLLVPCDETGALGAYRVYFVRGAFLDHSLKKGGFAGSIYILERDCSVSELDAACTESDLPAKSCVGLPKIFPGCLVSLELADGVPSGVFDADGAAKTEGCMRVMACEYRRGHSAGYVKLTVA